MTLLEFYKSASEIERNEQRQALCAAIYLMEDICPIKGWCLPGTGADYARNAVAHLRTQLRLLILESDDEKARLVE